jgi:hypothetical protein
MAAFKVVTDLFVLSRLSGMKLEIGNCDRPLADNSSCRLAFTPDLQPQCRGRFRAPKGLGLL